MQTLPRSGCSIVALQKRPSLGDKQKEIPEGLKKPRSGLI